MSITFLGLGYMGSALVKAHLKAHTKCTIWNRSPDKPIVSELQEAGATYHKDLQEAIKASEFLMICLPDHENVYEILERLDTEQLNNAFSKLKAIINLSNGSPGDSEKMSAWAQERHASVYIAGAIMAGPDNIGDNETSYILYSGNAPAATKAAIEQLISVLGRPEFVGASIGNAQLHNNASLAATYSLFLGVLLSTAILSKASSATNEGGKPNILKPFQSYVAPLLKPAVSEVDGIAEAVEQDNEDAMGAAVSMISASLKNLSRTCGELGVDPVGMDHFWKVCEEVVRQGGGGKGMTAVAKQMMKQP